jgi:hypothetical protein
MPTDVHADELSGGRLMVAFRRSTDPFTGLPTASEYSTTRRTGSTTTIRVCHLGRAKRLVPLPLFSTAHWAEPLASTEKAMAVALYGSELRLFLQGTSVTNRATAATDGCTLSRRRGCRPGVRGRRNCRCHVQRAFCASCGPSAHAHHQRTGQSHWQAQRRPWQ